MGYRQASLFLCKCEHESPTGFQASSQTRRKVAEIASQGTDWEVITLHVRNQLREGRRSEALVWAKKLHAATKEGDHEGKHKTSLLQGKTWFEALDPDDVKEKCRAAHYGIAEWNNPEAYISLAHSTSQRVEKGSQQRLEHMTKGAMAGHLRSMQELGLYYLTLHGRYAGKHPVSHALDSKIGFKWLELSTMLEDPLHEAYIWAGMA